MKYTITPTNIRPLTTMAVGIVYKQVPDWYGHGNRTLCFDIVRSLGDGPKPLVIWLGGGAWQEMNQHVYLPELTYLAENGYTVASVEYRTSEKAKFPAQIEDVKAAIRYIRAHAKELCVDPEKIAIMGESAGGHLASLAGVAGEERQFDVGENLNESSAVSCVVDWYGPVDFTKFGNGNPVSPESLLMGATAENDPEKARAVSPVSYVSPKTPPFLILHGDSDHLVPVEQSRELYALLRENNVDATLVELVGTDHGGPAFTTSEVKQIILDFLNSHLK